MVAAACDETEFIALCHRLQKPAEVAKHLKIAIRNVHSRMRRLESKGVVFFVDDPRSLRKPIDSNPARLNYQIDSGVILVGSDPHYVPDNITEAHKAFVKLCAEMRPKVVVMNGDVFDGGGISRWPRIGWDHKPTVRQEIEACQMRLTEVADAAKGAARIWPLGNHDARFETRLAAEAPQYEGVKGFHLKDHFPEWKPCWSFFVNENTVIKHRLKGGIHATRNNALAAGRTVVTGHLHSLKITPFSDYNGTRYGVDTGTLAEPYGEQFNDYTEDNPVDWRSGFAVLTYHKGVLLPPEICQVTELGPVFRGKVISV
jgi:hypothetical protein